MDITITDENNNIIFINPPTYKDTLVLPNYGLFHTKSELINIKDKLYLYDIEKISSYCDYITKYSYNQDWIKKQIISNDKFDINYDKLTTSGIANIAYLALYLNDNKTKNICLKHFNNWKNYEIKKNNKKKFYNKIIKYSSLILLGTATYFMIYKKKNIFSLYKKNNL